VGEGRGSTFLCGNAESPFSIHSCGITCGFKDFREHGHFFEEGEFVFVPIASGEGVTSVLARHEGVTGGSTNGVGGVVVGELETFVGKAVDVGSFEFCISEAGKVTVAEIIGKDVDDVWDGGLALQVLFGTEGLPPPSPRLRRACLEFSEVVSAVDSRGQKVEARVRIRGSFFMMGTVM